MIKYTWVLWHAKAKGSDWKPRSNGILLALPTIQEYVVLSVCSLWQNYMWKRASLLQYTGKPEIWHGGEKLWCGYYSSSHCKWGIRGLLRVLLRPVGAVRAVGLASTINHRLARMLRLVKIPFRKSIVIRYYMLPPRCASPFSILDLQ